MSWPGSSQGVWGDADAGRRLDGKGGSEPGFPPPWRLDTTRRRALNSIRG